jgi:hypothetical protein
MSADRKFLRAPLPARSAAESGGMATSKRKVGTAPGVRLPEVDLVSRAWQSGKSTIQLLDGTLLLVGPSPEIRPWMRDTMARGQSTTALSTRAFRRSAARALKKANKRERRA